MPFMTRKRTAINSHCPQAHHCPENIAIEAQEGTTGTYKVAHELIAGISGNHILYYLNQAKYCEKTYTFKISGGRTVTITLKFYTGMQITYTNVEASQHSGGKI